MSLRTAGSRNKFAQRLFADLPRRYDRLAEWLSFGQNSRWRAAMVDRIVPGSPRRVLDVASGTAGVALQLADRTSTHVIGIDLTLNMLRVGQRNISQAHLTRRVQLVNGRAEDLPFPDAIFDALTFTYLFRYVDDPQATLVELARVVKPGGVVASLEFMMPERTFWRAWWWGYTRFVLPVAGFFTGGPEWYRVGRFLGPSISRLYREHPVPETVQAWRDAGFEDVGTKVMSLGGGLVMWGRRSGG
ncbi:MAG: class I SAM-dependent methyltransferase [Acidimicrobiales bacterium]|jgi:demethylmenaquinone methyltransferase/2-methoxy-6-polyprenyl-1,4-benzoquinol methylase